MEARIKRMVSEAVAQASDYDWRKAYLDIFQQEGGRLDCLDDGTYAGLMAVAREAALDACTALIESLEYEGVLPQGE